MRKELELLKAQASAAVGGGAQVQTIIQKVSRTMNALSSGGNVIKMTIDPDGDDEGLQRPKSSFNKPIIELTEEQKKLLNAKDEEIDPSLISEKMRLK